MCHLLRALPGWEAIKTTRGHYRSCGKDPHACCVSHLLSDEPVVFSGREQTYTSGKDTGRYWDAGAKNVHWMIAAEGQVEKGIERALERVRSGGVLIEGNSFTEFVDVDYLIIAARGDAWKIKGSARRALSKASALYLWGESDKTADRQESFSNWCIRSGLESVMRGLPIYTEATLPRLVADLCKVFSPCPA